MPATDLIVLGGARVVKAPVLREAKDGRSLPAGFAPHAAGRARIGGA